MKVFAHRGFSGKYPENTMLAFAKAVEAGCDGIEIDVHLTKDMVPVIIHDDCVDRTSDGTGFIQNFICDELKELDCSYPSKFDGIYGPLRMPTLEEYFAWISREHVDIITNIDLKCGASCHGNIEQIVIDLIRKYNLEDKVVIFSESDASIAICKQLSDSIKCGVLRKRYIANGGTYAKACKVEHYYPKLDYLEEGHVRDCSDNGIAVNVWTVNNEEDMRRIRRWGVSTIITNYPDRARRIEDEEQLQAELSSLVNEDLEAVAL